MVWYKENKVGQITHICIICDVLSMIRFTKHVAIKSCRTQKLGIKNVNIKLNERGISYAN